MKKFIKSIQIVLGLIFFLAGLNGWAVFFGFSPFLPTSPEAMAFFRYPYLLFTEKTVEVVGGLLLLTNVRVPFALNILAPIVLNILLFHLFVDPSLLPLALLVTLSEGFLLWTYRDHFQGMFQSTRETKNHDAENSAGRPRNP